MYEMLSSMQHGIHLRFSYVIEQVWKLMYKDCKLNKISYFYIHIKE